MSELPINSIYYACEGEGVHVGTPQVFVRFQGCAIGCLNCDSKDTWAFDKDYNMPLERVLSEIEYHGQGLKRVSITGGDPLHPKLLPGVLLLSKELKSKGYFVNIEAAGTRIVHELFDLIDFISFDFKTPSTGVKQSAGSIIKMGRQYGNKLQVKSVIENEGDFKASLNCHQEVIWELGKLDFPWCLTPAYNLNEPFPKERFLAVHKWNRESGSLFRVIGQQHKWLHGPDEKQV